MTFFFLSFYFGKYRSYREAEKAMQWTLHNLCSTMVNIYIC